MIPTRIEAEKELVLAQKLNPGQWIDHSFYTGKAAQSIAARCEGLDEEKAYVLGILHDLGRRIGIVKHEHIYEGYKYVKSKGWDEVAKICMTHSYPIKEKEFITKPTDKMSQFIQNYIFECEYDDYDRLIQLCDSLAMPEGFCLLEKRFVDVVRRYGLWETTLERWNETLAIKNYFEEWMGCSVYDVLENVKETTFIEYPLLKLKYMSKNDEEGLGEMK